MNDILIVVMDTVRNADVDSETMPWLSKKTTSTSVYSSSSWTLPTHASLYTNTPPHKHGVTRPSHQLDSAPTLQKLSQEGYRIGAFSENPYFSSRYGFDHSVDFFDEDIHLKSRPSGNSIGLAIEGIDSRTERFKQVIDHVRKSDEPYSDLRNAIHLLARQSDATHEHNGQKILDHASEWLAKSAEPAVCIINLFDAHNPHTPTGKAATLDYEFSSEEVKSFKKFDGMMYMRGNDIDTVDYIPHDSWDVFFDRMRCAYRSEIRQLDEIIEQFVKERSDESTIIITSDHGQLFGEEGWYDHHGILHPNAVQIPYAIINGDQPNGSVATLHNLWRGVTGESPADRDAQAVEAPARVISDGVAREIIQTSDYSGIRDGSLLARRVGEFWSDHQTVYESRWGGKEIVVKKYSLTENQRELQTKQEYSGGLSSDLEQWLQESPSGKNEQSSVSRERLKNLGYL